MSYCQSISDDSCMTVPFYKALYAKLSIIYNHTLVAKQR